jgi:hypothetical protein
MNRLYPTWMSIRMQRRTVLANQQAFGRVVGPSGAACAGRDLPHD